MEITLHRHCKKIFGVTDYEGTYGFPCSSTALKFGNRRLLFCCGHQLKQFAADQIGICPAYGSGWIVTGNSMILPEISHANKDRELIDVRAFNFPVEVYAIPNFEREFFEVFDEDVRRPGRERVFIVYGYPIEFQEFEYDGKPYVHGRCLQTVGLYDGASNAPYSHRLIMKRRGSFDADGMSGGAVFYLGIDKTGFFVGLAGMIMRGSATSNYLHSVEASALRLFASTPVELGNNARDGYAPAP